MTKDELRQEYRTLRDSKSREYLNSLSKQIHHRLHNLQEYKDSERICFYISKCSEVETHNMIRKSLQDKKILAPKVNTQEKKLELGQIKYWDKDLEKGHYQILEPKNSLPIKELKTKPELIIVPGLLFDKTGNRIGRGKGYYDKFLKELQTSLFVGLAYHFQLHATELPYEGHDIPMDKIVTDKDIINCHR